jgi:hypothetical protein
MPYLKPDDRITTEANLSTVTTGGQLNYLVTLLIIGAWKANPRYSTVHDLYKQLVLNPEKSTVLNKLNAAIPESMTRSDVYAAAALAFHEFYRRVASKYEDERAKENGDVYEGII